MLPLMMLMILGIIVLPSVHQEGDNHTYGGLVNGVPTTVNVFDALFSVLP